MEQDFLKHFHVIWDNNSNWSEEDLRKNSIPDIPRQSQLIKSVKYFVKTCWHQQPFLLQWSYKLNKERGWW